MISCRPEEGKTSLAISLSISMAHSGWKVLLVDADMRKPPAAKRLNQEFQLGLSDYLTGKIEFSEALSETNITNLTYLSCGLEQSNPVELLCSSRFQELIEQAQSDYDFVLFDTPALESVVDGAIVASKVDASLMVVEMGSTKMKSVTRAKEQLESINAVILGVVLNKVKKHDYKRYYGSYNYFLNTKRSFIKRRKKKYVPLDSGTTEHVLKA